MLTNKNFVRSIAMLLALLMVTALCLTGCGNKAADEALTKAEEAKTLADDVNAALAGYLKTADAEATVKALVDAALADGVATKAEIAELSAKLANYVTLAQVEALITEKVAANAVAGAVTKAEIEEILSKYYTKEEVDAKFANYFGEFTAEEVLAILKDSMSLKEWDKTTAVVLETIADLQDLLFALEHETYLQKNMKAVNECLKPFGVEAFKKSGSRFALRDIKAIAKDLEYTILRQATLEDMAELKAAVDAACKVPTFEKSFKALKADLYGLGDLHTVGAYDGKNNAFQADKYAAAGFYHETPVAKDAAKQVQIVTLADKAGFHAFNKAHDVLLAEYYADKTAPATGTDGWITGLNAYTVYKVSENVMGVITTKLQLELTTADAPANSEALGNTVITDMPYLNKVFKDGVKENEVLASPLYTINTAALHYSTGEANTDLTTDWKYNGTFKAVIDDCAMPQNGFDAWKSSYTLVYAQLNHVQALADRANNLFEGGVTGISALSAATEADFTTALTGSFLRDVIYNKTATLQTTAYLNVTDDQFLAALTGEMCEPISNPLPTDYNYMYFLLDDVDPMVQYFLMANGKAYDAEIGGFNRYDLYERMMDKSFDLLWNKYKAQANEWANIILKDYISVVYEAKVNAPGKSGPTAIAVTLSNKTALLNEMNKLGTGLTTGEPTTADELTDGFLDAFLMGADLNGEIYTKLGFAKKFNNSNLLAFYLNNERAAISTTDPKATPAPTAPTWKYAYANPLDSIKQNDEQIRQRLTGSATYTELKIAQADLATYKATGVSVRKAFYDLLKQEVDNLDEIYGRFLFDDYRLMTFNNMAVKAEKIVTFYNKGVPSATQTAAVERYLTGIANEGTSTSFTTGLEVVYNKNDKGANTTIASVNGKKNDLEDTLINGFLAANINAVPCDKWALSSPSGTELVADIAMAKVDEFADAATKTIENMIIKANFLSYLYEARADLSAANIKYTNYIMGEIPTAWDIKSALINENGLCDDQITVIEFFHNMGVGEYESYNLDNYKTIYVDNVLKLVADKTNLHVLLLGDLSIDAIVELADQAAEAQKVFEKKLEDVKSSDDAKVWTPRKYSPYAAKADYEYIGTYAVDLDRILNTMPGRVTQYVTKAGNVNLY